jgi:hypothetical protein
LALPGIEVQGIGWPTRDRSAVPTELHGLRLGVLISLYLKYDNYIHSPPSFIVESGLNKF